MSGLLGIIFVQLFSNYLLDEFYCFKNSWLIHFSRRLLNPFLNNLKYFFFICSFVLCLPAWSHDAETLQVIEKIHDHGTFSSHAHLGWESRYSSEGRDALDGQSISNSSLELGYDHFCFGIWYGMSSNYQYEEWQYSFAVTQETLGIEYYFGYTHLIFPKLNESDDEWSVGISYDELPNGFKSSLDGYYSMDAGGAFFEWSIGKGHDLGEDLELSLSGTLGWNEDYVSDGHDGLNFFSLRTGVEKTISQNLSIIAYGNSSVAINQDISQPGDDLLKDFLYLGLGLEWDF